MIICPRFVREIGVPCLTADGGGRHRTASMAGTRRDIGEAALDAARPGGHELPCSRLRPVRDEQAFWPLPCAVAGRLLEVTGGGSSVSSAPRIVGVVVAAALTGGVRYVQPGRLPGHGRPGQRCCRLGAEEDVQARACYPAVPSGCSRLTACPTVTRRGRAVIVSRDPRDGTRNPPAEQALTSYPATQAVTRLWPMAPGPRSLL